MKGSSYCGILERVGMEKQKNTLQCFGHLEKVFPMGDDGFRLSPPECMKCPMATPCLQAAMRGHEGLKLEEQRIDRAYQSGLMGLVERWSKKKLVRKKIDEQAKKGKSFKADETA
jgi:hypothetical protein